MQTFILSGKSSTLSCDVIPTILLDSSKEYELGLLNFEAYNSIPNIEEGNNKFYVDKHTITIPTGTYDVKAINDYLNVQLEKHNCQLILEPNLNTLKCELKCSHKVDFTKSDSIAELLGFEKKELPENERHFSEHPVNILKVNAIKVDCSLTTGSYNNGELGHTIHEFFPAVGAGYKIIESPQNIIYLPIIKIPEINCLTVRIVDQDGQLINFREETITIRFHLKEK